MGLSLWFILHPQSPGVCIGLLALVAGIMSVRPDHMHIYEKVAWIVLLISFTVLEVRAIGRSDKDNQEARQRQNEQFQRIANGLSDSIRTGNEQFKATTSGISTTLEAANKTIEQTRPYAAIRFDRFEFAGAAPQEIKADTPYAFNYYFVNMGAATATNISVMAKIYPGKPDDKDDQIRIVRRFENDWSGGGKLASGSVLVPSYPSWNTIHGTFSQEEWNERSTIYFLLRFEYSDLNGTWRTDSCSSFQKVLLEPIAVNILHPCKVFQRFHYQIKPPA
ncbi:hypothetical protein [Granulicella sp. S156]|uniref:hypothetical protein n=1 Tax=Granulicella sp. S156 TaxID=1747224 RepID=UPI00131ECAA4|nr:hypothetical protein [Granulicella sp. S156]